jgi:hypothetical protein
VKRVALLALLGAGLAGCGSGGGAKPVADAAALAPPTTPTFVALKTDLGALPQVLRRFPFGPPALAALRRELGSMRGVLGPQLDVAIFEHGSVFFTQPRDEKRFEKSLAPNQVHARLRGWTAYTDNAELLDLVRHHAGALSARRAYVHATEALPRDAVVRAYTTTGALAVPGLPAVPALLLPRAPERPAWLGAAVSAAGDAITIEVRTPRSSDGAAADAGRELLSRVPAGAVLAATTDAIPGTLAIAGLNVRRVAQAVGEPAVAYIRPGLPFPEVTIVSKPADPHAALRGVARLVKRVGRPRFPPVPITVDGVRLQDVALGPIDLYYGVHDGDVVLSDTTDAVAALRASGEKLDVPALPEHAERLLYLDAERGLPALRAFATLANQRVPTELVANLRPLRTLFEYRARDAPAETSVAVWQTR